MTKTRPAPLGATYKRNVRPSRLSSRPDVAPSGARPVLFVQSYKDLAPTEPSPSMAKPRNSADQLESIFALRSFVYGTIRI
jgi:hypothetical protein